MGYSFLSYIFPRLIKWNNSGYLQELSLMRMNIEEYQSMIFVKGLTNKTYLYSGEDVPSGSFPHWIFQKIRFDPAISSTLVNSEPGLTISIAQALTLAKASGEHRGTAKLADVHDLIQAWPQQTAKSS